MRRVAIVHDWLVSYAGSERVLAQLLSLYPEAELFSVCDFLEASERGFLGGRAPKTTFIQHLPAARKHYRGYLPLMPLAIEQLDLSGYDLVISTSHAVAKGVLTGPNQLHISYVHTPIRYAWDLQHAYLRQAGLERGVRSWFTRYLLHRIRLWDARTANGVDYFVANSKYIAQRIWKTYRRNAHIIYPPVEVNACTLQMDKDDFYLAASRLVSYKRIDLIVAAFAQMPDKRLVVIGGGPEHAKIAGLAKDKANIELLGHQPADVLRDHLQRARAFVFAAEEDFGILPVEAQACGTPVIAFARGGCRETVVEGVTGLFFDLQSVPAIIDAVKRFEACQATLNPLECRENAERFAVDRFRNTFAAYVDEQWARFGRAGNLANSKPRDESEISGTL